MGLVNLKPLELWAFQSFYSPLALVSLPLPHPHLHYLLLISLVGLVWHSFEHIIHAGPPPEAIALWAAAISMIVKEGLYQWTMRIAKQEKSDVPLPSTSLAPLLASSSFNS